MIPREIVESIQSIEVIQVRDRPRLDQPQIDGQTPPPLFVDFESAPTHHASADTADVEAQRLAPYERSRRAIDVHVFPFEPLSPQHAVSAARGAIAGGGGFWHRVEAPLHRATKAAALAASRQPAPSLAAA
jgi:hypothetical protein